jgi:hypothetical protein
MTVTNSNMMSSNEQYTYVGRGSTCGVEQNFWTECFLRISLVSFDVAHSMLYHSYEAMSLCRGSTNPYSRRTIDIVDPPLDSSFEGL